MKKRVFGFILCTLLTINMMGCSKEETCYGFEDKEWLFYNEVTAEHQRLEFGADGTFSYGCECGEPIGDSDMYEKYDYDSVNGIITISNDYDNTTSEIEVIDYNDYHMMLKINGKIQDFVLEEVDTSSNFYAFEGEKYLSGYESRCTVVDMEENHIVYGPVNYDPEGLYEDGTFEQYELVENTDIYELTIRRYLSVQEDGEYEESYEVKYSELTQEDIQYILDSGSGSAFVWFSDEMKVEKIVFYGEVSVSTEK